MLYERLSKSKAAILSLRLMQNKRLQYFKGRVFKEFVNIVSQSIINAGYFITLRNKCHWFMSVSCNI